MFRTDPALAGDAKVVAGLARDISEVLVTLGLPEGAPKGLRVAYHAACSLQHGQQIKTAPKDLLKRAGFEVVEPADSHLCCGSAGTYNLLQPEISQQLKARKVQTLEARKPEVIAAGNIGCMMQIGSGTGCRWCIRWNSSTGRRAGRGRGRWPKPGPRAERDGGERRERWGAAGHGFPAVFATNPPELALSPKADFVRDI